MNGLVLTPAAKAKMTLAQSEAASFTVNDEQGGVLVVQSAAASMVLPAGVQATLVLATESVQGPVGPASTVPGPPGTTDHGLLVGLTDDDHAQYYNQARGDLRYELLGAWAVGLAVHVAAADPHPQYLTAAEVNAAYALLAHTHAIADVTGLQAALDAKAALAHTHTLANVTDVTMTVANLNTLDDGVNTALHFHDADRARANHTGTQLAATVSDFSTAADARIAAAVINALSDVVISAPANGQVLKYNGTNWINGTDLTGGGGAAITTAEVDFVSAAREKFFSVAHVGATVGQKVVASVSLEMPAGVAMDELEADPLTVAGAVLVADQVRLLVASCRGSLISGKRNVNYQLV